MIQKKRIMDFFNYFIKKKLTINKMNVTIRM